MKKILIIAIVVFSTQNFRAQLSEGGLPPGILFAYKSAVTQDIIDLPLVDTAKLIAEDKADTLKLKPYRYAYNHQVHYSFRNSGKWVTQNDGSRLWTLRLRSRYAYSILISFSEFNLPEGGRLFLYDQSKEYILGAFTSINNNSANLLTITPVPGDMVIIEYVEPADAVGSGSLTVGLVGHDYKNTFASLKDGAFRKAESCEVDINCDQGKDWQIDKHAVCRLLIPKSDGNTYMCTGSLVNNTGNSGDNFKPYILSANHCVNDAYAASHMVALFNYESPYCNGPDAAFMQTVSGATLKATTSNLDFSLSELNSKPPFSYYPYCAGWNINTTGITSVAAIHHPAGDVKKISADGQPPIQDSFQDLYNKYTHWRVDRWDLGATQGGSSGGPLFDQQHNIIGDLSGGFSSCGCLINCADYYAMISHSWSDYPASNMQLKAWLDPLNINAKKLNGYDPYQAYHATCDSVTNIKTGESPVLLTQLGWGYYAGTNSNSISRFVESFYLPDSAYFVGLYMHVAKSNYVSKSSSIKIQVWNQGTDGLPMDMLFSKNIYMNSLKSDALDFIPMTHELKYTGHIFIGFEISYVTPLDTFALYHSPKRIADTNTQYVYFANHWASRKSLNSFGLSMDLSPVFCDSVPPNSFPPKVKTDQPTEQISCFPNPSTGEFTIRMPESRKPVILEIFSITGDKVGEYIIQAGVSEYSCTISQNGVFIIRLSCEKWIKTEKILINH